MGRFDGFLIASDIDGTLIESGYINPKNVEKISYFMREGGMFSLSTGRSIGAVSDVVSRLESLSPSVVANGCMIYDFSKKEIIFGKSLPKKDLYISELVIQSGMDIGIEVHCGAEVYTLKRNRNTTMHQVYEKFTSLDTDFDSIKDKEWNKVLFACPSTEDREKLKDYLKNEVTDCDFIDTCAMVEGELHNYHEQIPKGVSKATALSELCGMLGIKKGCLCAIGDYYNDLEMLQMADISCAPVGSPDDIKQMVDFVSVSCRDGAVAGFIDYLDSNIEEIKKNGNIQ